MYILLERNVALKLKFKLNRVTPADLITELLVVLAQNQVIDLERPDPSSCLNTSRAYSGTEQI
jgi:hypothetical protein